VFRKIAPQKKKKGVKKKKGFRGGKMAGGLKFVFQAVFPRGAVAIRFWRRLRAVVLFFFIFWILFWILEFDVFSGLSRGGFLPAGRGRIFRTKGREVCDKNDPTSKSF